MRKTVVWFLFACVASVATGLAASKASPSGNSSNGGASNSSGGGGGSSGNSNAGGNDNGGGNSNAGGNGNSNAGGNGNGNAGGNGNSNAGGNGNGNAGGNGNNNAGGNGNGGGGGKSGTVRMNEQHVEEAQARHDAMKMFREGSPQSAISYLNARKNRVPGPAGGAVGVVEGLIEIAVEFYNRREMGLAREATVHATVVAKPIFEGPPNVSPAKRAEIYGNLGLLCEVVLFDRRTAQAYYDAAAAINPADTVVWRRGQTVAEQARHKGRDGK